jgi:hypothetical protein
VALRNLFSKFSTSVEEQDLRALQATLSELGAVPLDAVMLRTPQRLAGEIESIRVVPRAGADAIEATMTDGRGRVTAVFLGRRRIPGITPGRRMVISGVPTRSGSQVLIFNPAYTLLP